MSPEEQEEGEVTPQLATDMLIALMPPLGWTQTKPRVWQTGFYHETEALTYYAVEYFPRSKGFPTPHWSAFLYRGTNTTDGVWKSSESCYLTQAAAMRTCQSHKHTGKWEVEF